MRSGVLESPSGNLSVGVRIRPMLLGTLTKGGPSILLEFSTEIHQKPGHDKAYPCFAHISRSTLWKPAKIGIVESYDHGESNAVGCKDFGSELAEDVGIYRETIKGAQIMNIGAFLSRKLLSSSSSSFVVTLPSVLGRFQWCLG